MSLSVENKFSKSLAAAVTAASGDFTMTLTGAPSNQRGWLVIDEADAVKSETVFFHAVSGNAVSVYGINRKNPGTHDEGATVRMLTSAEIFNQAFALIPQAFTILLKGGLSVEVSGGPAIPGVDVPVASLTLPVGSGQNYVWYDPAANQTKASSSETPVTEANGIVVAICYSSADVVTSVAYRRYALPLTNLEQLVDVGISSVADGEFLSWSESAKKWVNTAFAISNLDQIGDVDASAPNDGDVLTFDSASQTWVPLQPSSSGTEPEPDGSTTTDEGTYWKTTHSDGSYVEYKTDGIYNYDSDGNLVSFLAKIGTYSAAGMAYTDGTTVNADGSITYSGSDSGVARLAAQNIYTGMNRFKENTLFEKAVYVQASTAASDTINFALSNTHIRALDATAHSLTLYNLCPGSQFLLFVNATAGATIASITCVDTNGVTLQTYCVAGALPNVSAGGTFALPIFVGQTAAHVFVNGPTLAVA